MPLEAFDLDLAAAQRPRLRPGAFAALMGALAFGASVSSSGCSSSNGSAPGTGGQVGTGGAAGGSATGGTTATGGAAGTPSSGGATGTAGSAGHAATGGAGGGGGRAATGGAGGAGGRAATGGAGGSALTLAQACMASCNAQGSLTFCSGVNTVAQCQQDCVTNGTPSNPSATCQTQYLAMLRCESTLPMDQWTCSINGDAAIPKDGLCTSSVCPWACCVKSLIADPDIWARCMSSCP